MGKQDIQERNDPQERRKFMKRLLNELLAFENLLDRDMIESGVRRIGAEQELFLVDHHGRPSLLGCEILEQVKDKHFTPELARFNLEFNMDPLPFQGNCLSKMEGQIDDLLEKVRTVANNNGTDVILTGILPTIRQRDIGAHSMTPSPRYVAMEKALTNIRGRSEYELRLTGLDELIFKSKSFMLESCNNSFQLHYQVSAPEFAHYYNIAQAITGPILAISTNSPLLFGKRLWRETRISLFQQTVDTRNIGHQFRDRTGRVSFGTQWVNNSIVELFQEDIARFRVLLVSELDDENPFEKIEKGIPPELEALQLHNGTVYRWNRPCYGIMGGKPHLRIENRVLPAGPTPIDEMANAALFFGVLAGMAEAYPNFTDTMEFDDAKANFFTAARQGDGANCIWRHQKVYSARDLILEEFIPLAREGLQKNNIASEDIDRYLGVIEERVKARKTGAGWMLHSSLQLRKKEISPNQVLRTLVSASIRRQKEGKPMHEWSLADVSEVDKWQEDSIKVEQLMATELFTVHPEELIDLPAKLMEWRHVRDVPVEDEDGCLIGMIRYRKILKALLNRTEQGDVLMTPVKDIMEKNPFTLSPDSSTLNAIAFMLEKNTTIPVVKDERLVGTISDYGISYIMGQIMEEHRKKTIEDGEKKTNSKQAFIWFDDLIAQQLMTKEFCSVEEGDSIEEVTEKMMNQPNLYILAKDHKGDIAGIVSYRAILRNIRYFGIGESVPISSIMRKNFVSIFPETPALSAISLMREKKVGCLPVIKEGSIVGILTEHDLCKMAHLFFAEMSLIHH